MSSRGRVLCSRRLAWILVPDADLYVIRGDREAMRGLYAPKRTIVLSDEEIEVYREKYGDPDAIGLDIRVSGRSCVVRRDTEVSETELAGTRHMVLGWQFEVTRDLIA